MVEAKDVVMMVLVGIILLGLTQVLQSYNLLAFDSSDPETTTETSFDTSETSSISNSSSVTSEDVASQAVGGLPLPVLWMIVGVLAIVVFYRRNKISKRHR